MRKILLLFICAMCAVCGFAQQLPNPGFEEFKGSEKGIGYDPVGWKGANVKRTVMGITAGAEMVSPDVNGRSGKCVRIHNEKVEAAGIGAVAPSWVTLGTPWNDLKGIDQGTASAGTDGGIDFRYRPDTLSVWIRRTYQKEEDANIVVYLWTGKSFSDSYKGQNGSCQPYSHYDEESDIRQAFDANACGTKTQAKQTGEGSWRSRAQFKEWTEVRVPIRYLNNDVPEKMNVILSSGNYPNFRQNGGVHEGSQMWCDDIRFIYSSVVEEMYLDNRKMPGFSKDVREYMFSLGAEASSVPVITMKRSGRYLAEKEYSISYGAIGEPTVIRVKAEDGSSETQYSITFVRTLSTESRPKDIRVGGVSLPSFNALVTSYSVELPYGTKVCPDITVDKAEEGQAVEAVKPETLPGRATVTVYAEDRSYKTVYMIDLTVGALNDNTLTDIRVNGRTIEGFRPEQTMYVVELPVGTTGKPTIEWSSKYPEEQDIKLVNNGIEGGATITVTPKGTTNSRVYRLTFRVTESGYSYLADLRVGGKTIDGFTPEKLQYRYLLPIGTEELPAIEWTKGDEWQEVKMEKGGLDGETKITVTAQKGNKSIYRIGFSTEKSSNSKLADIKVDGESIEGFSPDRVSYDIELPIGTDKMPEIDAVKGDAGQEVQTVPGGLDGITRLFVMAQDKVNSTTYMLNMRVKKANVSTLKGISVGGEPIADFSPDVTRYEIMLPRGTTKLPEIGYEQYDEWQTVKVFEGGVNGTTRIRVTAQSGDQTDYELVFRVEVSANASLRGISVGGKAIEPFHPDTLAYRFGLPSGTAELPEVTYEKGDEWQKVNVSYGGVSGVSSLRVQAEDGSVRTYTVEMYVEKSENAFLKMIYVGGEEIEGYEAERFDYDYELAAGTEKTPEVTVDKEAGQSVSMVMPAVTGTVRIEVMPEAGASNVYMIRMHYPELSDSRLKMLTIDGENIEGFAPDKTEYEHVIAGEGEEMPEVGYVKGDERQVVLTEDVVSERAVRVTVAAEDGTTTVYCVRFVEIESNNALLRGIEVGGTAIADFVPEKSEYVYELAEDVASLPELKAVKGDDGQRVETIVPTLTGRATIDVTSEDGEVHNIYGVTFVRRERSNPLLNEIAVDGVPVALSDDSMDDDTVFVKTDGGVPTITYEKGDETQSVAVVYNGKKSATVTVFAEDGTKHVYTIIYEVPKRTDASLKGIKVFDGEEFVVMEGFEPDTRDYTYELEWRTERVPAVSPVPGDEGQTMTVDYGEVNGETTIKVTAEDGETENEYRIRFETKRSPISTLSAIYVNGDLIEGFDSNRYDYRVELPAGTTVSPTVTWGLAFADDMTPIHEQQVEYTAAAVGDTSVIEVTAEDGSKSVYKILFEIRPEGKPNRLLMISMGGEPIEGFESNRFGYEVELPYGTTVLPKIEVVKAYGRQTVVTLPGAVNGGVTYVNVLSDGGEEEVTYAIKSTVSDMPAATLSSITVGGVPIEGFKPNKFTYVVPVESDQEVKAAAPENVYVNVLQNSGKHRRFEVYDTGMTDTVYYDVYLHYTNDALPNLDFREWTKARYDGGDKPTGWTVPADVADVFKFAFWKYHPKELVTRNGDGSVKLSTVQGRFTISGAAPGMMTLGDMNMSLAAAEGSTSSVSGGVPFRNTFDDIYMEYNPVKETGYADNVRFLFRYIGADGAVYEPAVYTDDYSSKNIWKTMRMSLAGNSVSSPAMVHVTVNSAKSENAHDLRGIAENTSEMLVRRIWYTYSSRLDSMNVCGVNVDVQEDVYEYTVEIDADFAGEPEVVCKGEVSDQEYDVETVQTDEHGREWTATVRVKAEDGTESLYTVNIMRAVSATTGLAGIVVDGVPLADFDAEKTGYTYVTDRGLLSGMPEVKVERMSGHSTVETERRGNRLRFTVTAENGTDKKVYTLRLAEPMDGLKSIRVAGKDDFVFNPDTKEYKVNLKHGETQPVVIFEKQYDSQIVRMSTGDTVRVVLHGERGDTLNMYSIEFERERPMSSKLVGLTIDGVPFDGFDKGRYEYELRIGDERPGLAFVTGDIYDSVREILTEDSVAFRVAGEETNVYVIRFVRELSKNANLAGIALNGEDIKGFIPSVYEYAEDVKSVTGNELVFKAGDEGQQIEAGLTRSADVATFKLSLTAADGVTERAATVRLNRILDDDTAIGDILVNGESIAVDGNGYKSDVAFDAEQTSYNIEVEFAEPKSAEPVMPAISAVAGSAMQTVGIERGVMGDETTITVTAENGDERVYRLNVAARKSDNASLHSIAINYEPLAGFDPAVTEYECRVTNPNDVPTVSYVAGNAFQTINVEADKERARITVTSESGMETKVYTVTFKVTRSSNAMLGAIAMDGETLAGFEPEKFAYSVVLPTGTTILPELTVTAGEEGQTVEMKHGGVRGETVITVTAQDGKSTQQYRIEFSVVPSEENRLGMIYINGEELKASAASFSADRDFDPDVRDYAVTFPIGADRSPVVTWSAGDNMQDITGDRLADGYIITVRPEVAEKEAQYMLRFVFNRSTNADLGMIMLDGEPLSKDASGFTVDKDFGAKTFNYEVTLPIGSSRLPEIAWTVGDQWQEVVLEEASDVNGTAKITVTAEDGVTVQVYEIRFARLLSSNSQLGMLMVDGLPIDGFRPDSLQYTVMLPEGVTELPEVTWTAGDEWQKVSLSIEINILTVRVEAEDGGVSEYSVTFDVKKSDVAYLNSISVGGEVLGDFDKDILEYQYLLPYGEKDMPEVTWEKGHAAEKVTYTPAANVGETAIISVEAESGKETRVYKIEFGSELSDNAYLAGIFIGGELITTEAKGFKADVDFAQEVFAYNIVLPNGTTELPEITWEGIVEDYESVDIQTGGINGTTRISVTSQDGMAMAEYVLNFSVALSSETRLKSIYIDGEGVNGFKPDVYEYVITYPIGTDTAELPTVESVSYEKMQDVQVVTVEATSETQIIVKVTAEDGSLGVYSVKMEIERSGNSLLADIKVDGLSIRDFVPTQFDYEYLLYPGAVVPEVEAVKGEDSQTVDVTMGTVGEQTYIFVTAEDGSESIYTIMFDYTKVNPGEKPNKDDVCWTAMGDGNYKASSVRQNVKVYVYGAGGLLVRSADVETISANEVITEPHDSGTILHFDREGGVFIYVFAQDGEIIDSGKFIR